jgi:exodeoxyribonuclease III
LAGALSSKGTEKRLDNLLAWLAKAEPDVVSLEELKGGAGSLSRECPSNSRLRSSLARGARYIEAAVQGVLVLVTSIYLPNGNPQLGPKFNYKLAWFERLIAHAAELMASGAPVVLAGDYNVVPTPQDIYPTRSLDNNALIQPESRQAFARLLAQGWTDALRRLQPDGPLWTFWDYKFERWPRDKGMRLDHFLLSPKLSDRIVDGGVDRWARGQVNASDHAPTWIMLDF